jgi:hypothetical protein
VGGGRQEESGADYLMTEKKQKNMLYRDLNVLQGSAQNYDQVDVEKL